MYYSSIKNINLKVKKAGNWLILLVLIMASQCVVIDKQFEEIPPGMWRGELELEKIPDGAISENNGAKSLVQNKLYFNFEITTDSIGKQTAYFINGPERIEIEDIKFIQQPGLTDSFYIDFPIYDSHLTGHIAENVMSGEWVVRNRENYSIPFEAHYGKDYLYIQEQSDPGIDLSGKWKMTLNVDGTYSFPGIGLFSQEGNNLYGTVKTETGDYRFMEGNVVDGHFYLGVFDGSHAFLIQGDLSESGQLYGTFSSGNHFKVNFTAERNDAFTLSDPDGLTYLKEGYSSFNFAFPTTEGDTVTLDDDRYKGKPVIVQIMGTYCPNCRDETRFLTDYLAKNDVKDLEIIALAFEKYKDKERAIRAVNKYKEKMNLTYEVLLAGISNKDDASEKLPMLSRVISYPTLIFINRDGEVEKIHTGFNGPATDEYEAFIEAFDQNVQQLISS